MIPQRIAGNKSSQPSIEVPRSEEIQLRLIIKPSTSASFAAELQAHVELELDWSLKGLWSVCWLVQSESRLPPRKLSIAKVLRSLRRTMREYKSDADVGEDLWSCWANARIDSYRRKNKTSRDYPRKKPKRQLIGIPDIQTATPAQRRQPKTHQSRMKQTGGTALSATPPGSLFDNLT